MKKVHKSVFFVILALVLAFVCITFFGVYTTYGDVTTTVVRGYKDMLYDRDLEDNGYIVLKADSELTGEQLKQTKQILEYRLALYGYGQLEVLTDAASGSIYISLPWDQQSASQLATVASSIAKRGLFEIRLGNEVDSKGAPTGKTETVLLNNDQIKSADMDSTSNSVYTTYGLKLKFTSEGKKALAGAYDQVASDDSPAISYWLDGTEITYKVLSEAYTDSTLTINDTSNSAYSNIVERIILIRSGVLPATFTTVETVCVPYAAADSSHSAVMWTLLGMLALACILFIALFRVPGVCAAVALLLQSGITMALQTGMFSDNSNRPLTFIDLAAAFAALMTAIFVYAVICSKVSSGVHAKLSPAKAVLNALNGPSWRMIWAYAALFAAMLCGYLLTKPEVLYGTSLYAYSGDMFMFFYMAMMHALGLFGTLLVFRLLLKAVSGGNWRGTEAFASPIAKGKPREFAHSAKALVAVVSVVLVVAVALAFVLPGKSSYENSGMKVYSAKYTTEDVDSTVLTPALLELDSSLEVSYGYTNHGTNYCVSVSYPTGSEVTGAEIKAVLDKTYADTFTETINISVGGNYSSAQLRNTAIFAVIALAIYGAIIALFANKIRIAGLIAPIAALVGAAVTSALLHVCGMAVGHVFIGCALASLMLSAAVAAIVVFEINGKMAGAASAAVNAVFSEQLGGYAGAAVIVALLSAGSAVAASAFGVTSLLAFSIAMLAVGVLSIVYCVIAANACCALKK